LLRFSNINTWCIRIFECIDAMGVVYMYVAFTFN
jgi:hypothetical protein